MKEVYELAVFDLTKDAWVSVGIFPSFNEACEAGEEIMKRDPFRYVDWEFAAHDFCPDIDRF